MTLASAGGTSVSRRYGIARSCSGAGDRRRQRDQVSPNRLVARSDVIAAIAEANRDVVVVTADRELAERVRAANAEVVGPSWLLDQLVD